MLKGQLAKGNNGLTKTKYITFGVEADSLKAAKPRLERIETDILTNFKTMGVRAHSLNGYERLAVLYQMLHPMEGQKLRFAWDAIWKTGLSSKDFIAPDSFTFKSGRTFQIGQTHGAVSFLQILTPELTDRMLADFLDLGHSQVVTMHIQSIDQSAAIKNIKRKITDLDAMKMRYTLYRGLAQVCNWVRLKFAAMNLKKLAIWKSRQRAALLRSQLLFLFPTRLIFWSAWIRTRQTVFRQTGGWGFCETPSPPFSDFGGSREPPEGGGTFAPVYDQRLFFL